MAALRGNMQDWSMQLTHILDYAARWHPEQEIVSRSVEGPTTISTYADLHRRTQLCALALRGIGVRPGTMVATLAWNTTRHVEAWFAIFGSGAVCHTLNPRLADKDLRFIMNDAKDVVLLSDLSFAAQLSRLVPLCRTITHVVILTDRQHMPGGLQSLPCPVLCYEELLDAQVPHLPFRWVSVPEDSACGLCYTSGTTGNPKGVLYSHRSNFLHALISLQADSIPLASNSTCMAVVPMFHANVWGLIFSAPMVGAKLVLPGPYLDGESVYRMMESFKVTVTAAVPTVWSNLLSTLEERGGSFSSLKLAVIGGAPATLAMIEGLQKRHGVTVHHLWGMTEISPIGTVCAPKAALLQRANAEGVLRNKLKQGRPHALCDMRIVDDEGKVLPHDGRAFGHLQVRGPIVVHHYLGLESKAVTTSEGWFATGDVCSIDALGHMQITDRSKDVIKSGGEWISSLDMENVASSHPDVAEAAVIAVPHPKWGERPLLIVVPKQVARHHLPGTTAQAGEAAHAALKAVDCNALRASILAFLDGKIAKYAMPDDVVVVAEICHNATGKISKLMLREMFKDYKSPAERTGSDARSKL